MTADVKGFFQSLNKKDIHVSKGIVIDEREAATQQGRDAAECLRIEAEAEDIRVVSGMKLKYADKVYDFMVRWCLFFAIVLIFYMSSIFSKGEVIPEKIVIAFFTSTTVVIGLVGFVIKGLFNGNGTKK